MKIIRNHVGVMQIEEELYVVMKFKRMSSIFVGVPRPGLLLVKQNEIYFFSKKCFPTWRMPFWRRYMLKELFQNAEESKSPHLVCSFKTRVELWKEVSETFLACVFLLLWLKVIFLTLLHRNSRDQVNHMVVSPVFAPGWTELLPTMGIVSHGWKSL